MDMEWTPFSQTDLAKFRSQLVAGLQGLLNLLEETERRRKLPRTSFDLPVQERMRRAS
jgi:hypothetical protein